MLTVSIKNRFNVFMPYVELLIKPQTETLTTIPPPIKSNNIEWKYRIEKHKGKLSNHPL